MAGDTVRLVVVRGENPQRIEMAVELVAAIEPYVRPEMGLLPMRTVVQPAGPGDAPAGVLVRHVFPDGPAAKAGLQVGDRIVALGQQEIGGLRGTARPDHYFRPRTGRPRAIRARRADSGSGPDIGSPGDVDPGQPPCRRPCRRSTHPQRVGPPSASWRSRFPRLPISAWLSFRTTTIPRRPYGLVVWLHPPGKFVQDELVNRWKQLAQDHDLIVLAPQSADEKRWLSTEIEFVGKTIDDVLRTYSIDPTRVVLHGYQAGGAMAYYVAFAHRDVARAVVPVGSPLPSRLGKPATDPVQPLAVYSVSSEQSELADRVVAGRAVARATRVPGARAGSAR